MYAECHLEKYKKSIEIERNIMHFSRLAKILATKNNPDIGVCVCACVCVCVILWICVYRRVYVIDVCAYGCV